MQSTASANFKHASIVGLKQVTEGQACTCAIGLEKLEKAETTINQDSSIFIGACDNSMLYNKKEYAQLSNNPSVDVIALSFKNHPSSSRNPQMYGWIKVDDNSKKNAKILGVSVKKPISDNPQHDHAIVGAFYFRKAEYFTLGLKRLMELNKRVNGEFYVDSIIGELAEMGYHCNVFQIDDYICWGTPDDLRTFEYWQEFFHKCSWHPYKIQADKTADLNDSELLNRVEHQIIQPYT
jgi:hypothetical protein